MTNEIHTEDSIGVKYQTAEPNVQHDEAMQLITEHCVGGYLETRRVEYAVSRSVYALPDHDAPSDAPTDGVILFKETPLIDASISFSL